MKSPKTHIAKALSHLNQELVLLENKFPKLSAEELSLTSIEFMKTYEENLRSRIRLTDVVTELQSALNALDED